MKNNIIIGLGTGRCGTTSLSRLLNIQKKSHFTHEHAFEKMPWKIDEKRFKNLYSKFLNTDYDFLGDVSFYNLPYVDLFLKQDPNTKFILLKRNREAVVKSFLKKTRGMNHWNEPYLWDPGTRESPWDKSFPKFTTRTKAEAIGQYWDYYYELCEKIDKDKVYQINLRDLNNEKECIKMLNFCGFEEPIVKTFKMNCSV